MKQLLAFLSISLTLTLAVIGAALVIYGGGNQNGPLAYFGGLLLIAGWTITAIIASFQEGGENHGKSLYPR